MENRYENVVSSKKQMACKLLWGARSAREEVAGAVQVRRCAEILIACQTGASSHVPKDTRDRGRDKSYHARFEPVAWTLSYVRLVETEVGYEQEQDASEEEDVHEVELSVEEDELVEDTA